MDQRAAESLRTRRMPSTKIRFLGSLQQPTPTNTNTYSSGPSPLDELDEGDLFWSSSSSEQDSSVAHTSIANSTTTNNISTSPLSSASSSSGSPRPFHPSPSSTGLSAALADNNSRNQFIQRNTTGFNPTTSAATAAVSIIAPSNNRTSESGGSFGGSYYGKKKKYHQSAPVNVPVWPTNMRARRVRDQAAFLGGFDEDVDAEDFDDDDAGEMIPPHEIVARSDKTTAFSVFEGVGRTLKGRDLTKVRNAIMQKTGFLE